MKDRWEKGDPVNLSDLLQITPVANEILRLGNELDMDFTDIMWIVGEIIKDCEQEQAGGQPSPQADFELESDDEELEVFDDDWEGEEDSEDSYYQVYLKINSKGRFPEVSFKADVNEKEDLNGFLNMVIDVMKKLEI